MTSRLGITFALALAGGLGWTAGAAANSVTINNTAGSPQQTLVEADQIPCSGSPSSCAEGFFSGGTYWGANVGGPSTGGGDFQTTGLTASFTPGNGSTTYGTVTLIFNTLFAAEQGVDNVSGAGTVYAADIFIKSNAAGDLTPSSSQTFNYAISLGYTQTADGGLAEGFYQGTGAGGTIAASSYLTSTQVWGGRGAANGDIYGGAFASAASFSGSNPACSATSTTCSQSEASPTVLTGGSGGTGVTAVSGIAESEAWNTTADTLTVTLAATSASGNSTLDSIFSDFDIFWGTGDCSNAPIWGNVAGLTAIPEPSSLALLLLPALGVFLYRRKKARPAAV